MVWKTIWCPNDEIKTKVPWLNISPSNKLYWFVSMHHQSNKMSTSVDLNNLILLSSFCIFMSFHWKEWEYFFCAKCSTLFTAQYPWADSKFSSNDRLRYYVMTSLIGWAQALNQPCIPPHPQAKTLQMSKTNTKVSLSNNPKTMAICCQNHQTDIDVLAPGQNGCQIADNISTGNSLTENN